LATNLKSFQLSKYKVDRDREKCIDCKVCVNQCGFGVHEFDEDFEHVVSNDEKCAGCSRCVSFCPTGALEVRRRQVLDVGNANWTPDVLLDIYKQSETGGVLLSSMGCDLDYPIYWDKILLNASQVTNPSIDPLREPMELRTYLGNKPDSLDIDYSGGDKKLKTKLSVQLELKLPVLFSAMSFGAISFNACYSLARAAWEYGTFYNTGEGGLHKSLYKYGKRTIVQVASGRFGVEKDYLDAAAAVEIKIGQGAKPGIGGHLPGEKVDEEISQTRMIPVGSDALSPAPHHDVYSIEDLRQLIYAIKEATNYEKPVIVKIAAVHNVAAIASGIVRAGADVIAIDGFRGSTGAAPKRIRDNVGIPIELALAAVDERLRQDGIRSRASIIAAGGFRNSADIIKAIALGADAIYIGTAALVAMGCHVCGKCYTGICNWGIATQDPYLVRRLNPEIASQRLVNLLKAWEHEMKEILGGMGINAIESLRGNRHHLRGVGLSQVELDILGIRMAGQ
jgi:glutamate synthase domain-containing protein 2/NAD-dependent dihydropyrimidine dehydrogenase PreA subunit